MPRRISKTKILERERETMKTNLRPFVLSLAMIAGIIFAGCKNSPSGGITPDSVALTTAIEETTEAKPSHYEADYLPDAKYGGYEFRMVAPSGYGYAYMQFFADVEQETGDVLADAIYKRNRTIEQRYDISIKQIEARDYAHLTSIFQKSANAGTDDFDLCMLISRDAWSMALEGKLLDVNKLPYLDISKPWYSHEVNSEISVNGKMYFAYSDECLNMFTQTVGIMFNKDLVQKLDLENMYNLVKDNKWTMDKFFALSKAATADIDGNGVMDDADRYGIVSEGYGVYPSFWVSSGIKTVSKDENDLLVFTGNNEKLYNILETTYQNIFGGAKIFFDSASKSTANGYFPGYQFENELGLFFVVGIGYIGTLRAMETDFGVLPFPKCDEKQEKYYSRVIDAWINCVPIGCTNLERTSVIMESLAVESKNITVPAYYEVAVRTKYARDEESQDMLEIIHDNMTMDLGDTFYMDAVRNVYMGVFGKKDNHFASAVEKSTPAINKILEKTNNAALALD